MTLKKVSGPFGALATKAKKMSSFFVLFKKFIFCHINERGFMPSLQKRRHFAKNFERYMATGRSRGEQQQQQTMSAGLG